MEKGKRLGLENEVGTIKEYWPCAQCEAQNRLESRFCKNCGKPRFTLDSEFGKKSVYPVMSLYFILLIAIIFIYFVEPGGSGWLGEFFAALILAVITMVFVFFDPKDFLRYFFPQRLRWSLLFGIILITPMFSFAVSNVVNWFNKTFFDTVVNGMAHYYDAPNPLLFAVIFTAVCPAFFEELAFRGVVFSRGRGIFSLKQTIWVSSILFMFLHLSIWSFLWILPFALVLGYTRAKFRTTFYGMCIHFLHNFTAVMLEYYGWDNFLG